MEVSYDTINLNNNSNSDDNTWNEDLLNIIIEQNDSRKKCGKCE